jgi:glycosyltransferase involved in cell wall biosynthesis
LGWATDEVVLLFVGVLSPQKGVGDLLDAWQTFTQLRTRARLVLAGPRLHSPSKPDLWERAGQLPSVDRLGRVSGQKVSDLLRAADAFVLPTHGEGLPNALLEAMACGLPSVVSHLEGITDYLILDGQRGRLVPTGNADRLGRAMTEVVEEADKARRWGRNAREWVERHASLGVVAEAYERLFLSLDQKDPK